MDKPNIVLLCLDSVRKDAFDELATEIQSLVDISYDGCRSASIWSIPSHGSIFTGQLPYKSKIHSHNVDFSHLDRHDTFLSDLRNHKSIGVSDNSFLSAEFGFADLFDRFTDVTGGKRFPQGTSANEIFEECCEEVEPTYTHFVRKAIRHEHPVLSLANGFASFLDNRYNSMFGERFFDSGASVVSRAIRQSIRESREPFFLFANYMEAHTPHQQRRVYDTEESVPNNFSTADLSKWESVSALDEYDEYVDNFRKLYRKSVVHLDKVVASDIRWLLDNTVRETTIIVTADHGESLGLSSDEGLLRHTSELSEGLLHVPLVVINPPREDGESTHRYVSHLNLPTYIKKLSFGELVDPTQATIPVEVVGMGSIKPPSSNQEYWDRAIRGIYRKDTKVVWDSLGNSAKYKIDLNRPSQQEIIEEDIPVPETSNRFFGIGIETYKKEALNMEDEGKLDASVKYRLKELGYL